MMVLEQLWYIYHLGSRALKAISVYMYLLRSQIGFNPIILIKGYPCVSHCLAAS